jgi:hypothetical protein
MIKFSLVGIWVIAATVAAIQVGQASSVVSDTGCEFKNIEIATVDGQRSAPQIVVCRKVEPRKRVRLRATNVQVCNWAQNRNLLGGVTRLVQIDVFVERGKSPFFSKIVEVVAQASCAGGDFVTPPIEAAPLNRVETAPGLVAVSLEIGNCDNDRATNPPANTTCDVRIGNLEFSPD